ncbi:MAG: DUF4037 domain-containing protein [Calditrichaeota bacterium]|nr:MAG: DUF4037 domain-containing protein [Calditrichota bacterium]
MNEESLKLQELAKKLLPEITTDENVEAVSIVGSVAYGMSDSASDIDLLILFNKLTDEKIEQIKKFWTPRKPIYVIGGKEAGFITVGRFVDKVKIDFGHLRRNYYDEIIENVCVKGKTDLEQQAALFGLLNSTVLFGENYIEQFRKKIRNYPDKLQTAMLKTFCHFTPKCVYDKMIVDRNDKLFFYESALRDLNNVIAVLFSLNKIYHPGKAKGIGWILEKQFKIKPKNLEQKIDLVLTSSLKKGTKVLFELINETMDLVSEIRPNFDLSFTKSRMNLVLRES